MILGMPFDVQGHGPNDDRARLQRFGEEADTVVWLPSQLSERALRELGTLIRIDFLLIRNRLEEHARHLSPSDREQARALLQNQRSQLYQRLRACLEAAYGIRADQDNALGLTLEPSDHFVSLEGTFRPLPPVGADLKEALGGLLDRIFEHRFPAHPFFEEEIKPASLRKVLEEVQRTAQETGQRAFVERALRSTLRAIAGPLRLGTMNDTHLVLDPHWASHFGRMHAQQGGGPVTVGLLREWMDQPKTMGLPRDVQNLVVLAYAAQADRTPFLRGAPVKPTIDRLEDEIELREQPLPDEVIWTRARKRAATLFGLPSSELRKGATVERLAGEVLEKAEAARPAVASLAAALRLRMTAYSLAADTTPRMTTLQSAAALIAALTAQREPHLVVGALAAADLQTSAAAVAQALARAGDLQGYLTGVQWDALKAAADLQDHRRAAGEAIHRKLVEALDADEHVIPLSTSLQQAQNSAWRLLAEAPSPVDPQPIVAPIGRDQVPAPDVPSQRCVRPGDVIVDERVAEDLHTDQAMGVLDELRNRVESEPTATLSISWRLTKASGVR